MQLADLVVDDRAAGIFRVHRSALTAPDILALEREHIFERCWLYVGHESEVPNPGDFRRRNVANRSVIFTRGSDGVIRTLLNTCAHRGARVCRQDQGNAKTFQCFYHAWTYDNRGELVGLPGEDAYGSGFDRTAMGLKGPPRQDSYRGFHFVCFDPDAVDLGSYLGDAREYIDLVVDQSETGLRLIPGEN